MGTVGKLDVKIGADIKAFEDALKTLKNDLGVTREEVQKGNESFSDMQTLLATIGATKAISTLWSQLTACVDAAIAFESALAGVAKTTDLTSQELTEYSEAIMSMGEEIPLTTTELLGISEAAGQLGISGKDNLLSFTEVMAKLGTATNMTAEEGATMLAQFANITSMPADQYENLGSTIVALGNSSATTESQITEMAQGIAAAGTNAGMSEADILALAAAASSVGIEAAAGSTSWSTLIQKIQIAVETGNDLEQWASVAGMTGDEFKRAFKDNAAGAIDSFITGLGNAQQQGQSMNTILINLGITETRQQRLFQSLANSGGLLTDTLETANGAWSENTALNKEAATRFATTESKVQLLKNKFGNLQTTIGNQLNPAFNVLVDVATSVTDAFNDFAEEHDELGPILASITVGIIGFTVAITAQTIAAKLATEANKKLMLSMMSNPITLAITAITTLVTALITFGAQAGKATDEMEAIAESAKNTRAECEELVNGLNQAAIEADRSASLSQSLVDRYNDLASVTNRTQTEEWQLQSVIEQLNEMFPELELSIDGVNGKLTRHQQEIINTGNAQAKYKAIMEKTNNIIEKNAELEYEIEYATKESERAYNNLTPEVKKALEMYEHYNDVLDGTVVTGENIEEANNQQSYWYGKLGESGREYLNTLERENEVKTENGEQIEINNEILETNNELLEAQNGLTQEQNDYLATLDETERAHVEAALQAGETLRADMDELIQKYAERKQAVYEDLWAQYDWQEGLKQSSVDLGSLIDTFNRSAEAATTYGDNIAWLADHGVTNLEEIGAACGMPKDAIMGLAQALVDNPDKIPDFVAAYGNLDSTFQNTAGIIAGAETDITGGMEEIKGAYEDSIKSLEMSDESKKYVSETMEGILDGIDDYDEQIQSAMQDVIDGIKSKISNIKTTVKINSTYNSTGRAQVSIGAYDVGGYFDKPQIIQIAEKRPEFVGAADDLETFISKSVNNAFVDVNPILLGSLNTPVKNGSNGGVKIEVNMPIQVSKSLSDTDIKQKAKTISRIVGKEFATATGGKMS